ncbi:MAG TPA: hypothetical protein VND92_08540 [Vicinamibacterales bacterium]|nr:hypothetical protein [Vicinamibacterales bacterium]
MGSVIHVRTGTRWRRSTGGARANDGFVASYPGHCRGCGDPWIVGERIHSAGKGRGAFHAKCWLVRDKTPGASKRR